MGLVRLPLLAAFLGEQPRASAWPWSKGKDSAWLGWGRKRSMAFANWYAMVGSGQVACLEDGFLRSFGTGQTIPALALVLDDEGIYYDSTRPSALEVLLTSSHDVLSDHEVLVDQALRVLLEKGMSKYNHAADGVDGLLRRFTPRNDNQLPKI